MSKKIYGIGICGKMGSGKTTIVQGLAYHLKQQVGEDNSTVLLLKFAQPIYEAVSSLHVSTDPKPRSFMQRYGELCREEFNDDVFERALEKRMLDIINNELPQRNADYTLFLCDDIRFKGEEELLRKHNFLLLKVEADDDIRKERLGITYVNDQHRSEKELEEIKIDRVIKNNDDFIKLMDELKDIVFNLLRSSEESCGNIL